MSLLINLITKQNIKFNLSIIKGCQHWKLFHKSINNQQLMKNVSAKELKYKKIDKMNDNFHLIYRAPMENYLIACKHVTSFTFLSIAGIALFKLLRKENLYASENLLQQFEHINADSSEIYGFLIGFLVISVLLRVIIQRYPLRIYKCKNSYVAIFEGQLPFKNKKLNFIKGEVITMPIKGILPWRESRYKIKNEKVLLLIDYFKTPSELNIMLKRTY